jgi:hypothetical protein
MHDAHEYEDEPTDYQCLYDHVALMTPNVRAEATREAGRPWAAQDNGACDCPARPKGGTPRGVASRARG